MAGMQNYEDLTHNANKASDVFTKVEPLVDKKMFVSRKSEGLRLENQVLHQSLFQEKK